MLLSKARIKEIETLAGQVTAEYDTHDPYELADWLNYIVDLGDYPELLGFCLVAWDEQCIGLNARADCNTRRCACAHEVGHLLLGHLKDPRFILKHYSDLSNMTSLFEAEANCFAAALLIGDQEAVEAIQSYGDAQRAAASIYVCPELYDAKMRILNAKGASFEIPDRPAKQAWRYGMPEAVND